MSINSARIDNILVVNVARPSGGADIYLEPSDIATYLKDPDAFAAGYFGLTKVEYLEWVQVDGNALCGARTRNGDLCRNLVGGGSSQLDAGPWKARHRKSLCKTHGG